MCMLRSPYSLSLLVVLVLAIATDATAQVKMYWGAYETHNIRRADLDGSNIEVVIPFANFARTLFVHGGKIYWTDFFPPQISRANTDGSNIEIIVTERYAVGMTLAEGKIYYSHRESNTDSIFRANLDGQEEELLIEGLDRRSVLGITVGGEKLYVTDRKNNKIFRANLDGSNPTDIITGLQDPNFLALDLSGGKLYWTDTTTNKIQRADLDGSNVEDLVTGDSANLPGGLSLDLGVGKMYWTSYNASEIRRADLNGSNVELLLSFPDDDGPLGVYIDTSLVALPSSNSWVDFGFVGIETGSADDPFNTLAEGLLHTLPTGTVMIKGNTGDSVSNETMTIQQAVTIEAVNGTVRIGDSAGRGVDSGRQTGFVSRD